MQSQAVFNSPTPSQLTDLSTNSLNPSSLPKPLSRSSSNHSSSVDSKAYNRAHLCDEVLAAHFSAASQGLRLEAIEEKASKADQEMSKAKAELAATEAQEAMQCVMWKNMFEAEINQARIYKERAEHVEVRWRNSKAEASTAKMEQQEVDRLRAEVVDRGAGWASERERLLDEIYALQASLASHEGRVAGFELQVQKSSEAAAQATVMRCNELEALAMVRQEAEQASLRAEATESQRVATEQQRLEATALAEAMKMELEMAHKNEETSVALALAEARSEAVIAREAKTKIAELQIEVSENETLARVQALENERRKDAEEATRMHADSQQALELLCSFMQKRESDDNSSKESDMCAIREFQDRILAQSEAAASKEASAVAEAKTEATKATAAQKHCDELRTELAAQGRAQRDLHNELQALSNAAAAVRAVAAAKDDTIAELQATSKLMVSELAMSANSPAMYHRKAFDGKHIALELSRNSGASGTSGSTVGDCSAVTPPSVTPSDSLSQVSAQTLGNPGQGSGLYRSAANAPEGLGMLSRERSTNSLSRERSTNSLEQGRSTPSLVDRVRSGSPQAKAAEPRVPAELRQRTPMRLTPVPVPSQPRSQSFVPPSHQEDPNQLSQAAAFLNAAAAKAAAAASAVEAFFPFVPSTMAPTTSSNQDESTPKGSTTSGGSDAPHAGTSSTASKQTSSRQADRTDTGRFSQTTQDSGTSKHGKHETAQSSEDGRGPDGKSWEEAQAVMTEQIRKDISLLRKALSDSGMQGSALEQEVQALEQKTTQQAKDVEASPAAASRSTTLGKSIPPAIRDPNGKKSNMRRLSPSQSASNSGSLKVGSFANNPQSKNHVGIGGSLRVQGRTSPERQMNGGSPAVPLPREGVQLAVSEVVVGSGGSHSFVARSPSAENSGNRSPDVPRASFVRVPPADVRTQSRDTGTLMSSSSEVSLRREASQRGLMASASEVSLGQSQSHRMQVKQGPPRGVYAEVQAAPGGVPPGRFAGARSGSPPQNRPTWFPSRNGSPAPPHPSGVTRMVSVPARCQSPLGPSAPRM